MGRGDVGRVGHLLAGRKCRRRRTWPGVLAIMRMVCMDRQSGQGLQHLVVVTLDGVVRRQVRGDLQAARIESVRSGSTKATIDVVQ